VLTLDEVEDSLECYQRHVHPQKDSKKAGRSDAPEITFSAVAAPQREHAGSVARQATRRKTVVRDLDLDLENLKLAVAEMISWQYM
jgi:hypothetical protein